MRRRLVAVAVLVAAGCTGGPVSTQARSEPIRVFVAGTVDLAGPAVVVARADPEGVLREVRFAARRADLAIAVSIQGGAGPLLAAAGFDVVACPHPESLTSEPTSLSIETPAIRLRCAGDPDPATDGSPVALNLTIGDPSPAGTGAPPTIESPSVEVIVPRSTQTDLVVSRMGALLSDDPSAEGSVLEVLADEAGVIAYRTGGVTHSDLRVHFAGWDLPEGDAVLLDGEWWTLIRAIIPAPVLRPPPDTPFEQGDLTAAALGDVTGDGVPDLAAAYRHPFRGSALTDAFPGAVIVDSQGRSAHLGVFTPEGEPLWAAGLIPHPVGDVAACVGSVALAFTDIEGREITSTGAATWEGLSLRFAQELPGGGVPGCADVDADGSLDPVILERSP